MSAGMVSDAEVIRRVRAELPSDCTWSLTSDSVTVLTMRDNLWVAELWARVVRAAAYEPRPWSAPNDSLGTRFLTAHAWLSHVLVKITWAVEEDRIPDEGCVCCETATLPVTSAASVTDLRA